MKKIVFLVAIAGLTQNLFPGVLDDYSRACSEGDTSGCYRLGVAYRDGSEVGQDLTASRQFFHIGCDMGDTQACEELKDMDQYRSDSGNPEEKQDNSTDPGSLTIESNKIKEYVLGVIKHGSARFNYPMGTMPKDMVTGTNAEKVAEYLSGGMKGEEPASFAACAACHGADGRGDGGLSADLLNMKGVEFGAKEDDKIVKYKKTCDRGDGDACSRLGSYYESGKRVKRNYIKAEEYYKKACDFGESIGCIILGQLYQEGEKIKHNDAKVVEYYGKACDLGESVGCYILAFKYIDNNRAKAKRYFKKACDLGDNYGCTEYKKMISD